ncbi:MAG: alpha/beta hydrolase-fold protein [Acidobacteriota bacterium]
MRLRRLFLLVLLTTAGCRAPLAHDHPQLAPDVRMTDITLFSRVLDRDMPVRVIAPAHIAPGQVLPVIYLLHGAGEDFRTWTNETPIAALAASGVILVMPDGAKTYYVNDASGHRYEDFFFTELIPAIHQRYPQAATDRAHTAIAGNSRGGYAATLYSLKHPELFSYVAALSSAYDLAERRFRWRTPGESMDYRRTFGPQGSPVRAANNPYALVAKIPAADAPYFYLTCAEHDSLLPPNQSFVGALKQRNLPYEFHLVPGGHSWSVWNEQLPTLEAKILTHFGLPTPNSSPTI